MKFHETSPDQNVEELREKFLQRSKFGMKKYGTTTEREDLHEYEWMIHHQEELMDALVYLQRRINDKRKELGPCPVCQFVDFRNLKCGSCKGTGYNLVKKSH